jgi:hypothetical protein
MVFAEYFDIFGLLMFIFISVVGALIVKGKKMPVSIGGVLFLIGILGVIIDGYIVINTFIIGG